MAETSFTVKVSVFFFSGLSSVGKVLEPGLHKSDDSSETGTPGRPSKPSHQSREDIVRLRVPRDEIFRPERNVRTLSDPHSQTSQTGRS
jgi:hypothetical protein